MQCHYCKRFQKESPLEYLPNKKSYYCKLCGNYFGEDEINASLPKKATKKMDKDKQAGSFPLTVIKEDEPKSVDAKKLISKKA